MKRKLITGLTCFVMCLLFFTVDAFANEPVDYLDGTGSMQSSPSYVVLDADTTAWADGWYIADGEVTIPSRVEVSGAVNLILIDGCTLTVKGGIHVKKDVGTLTIYGQSTENAGTLIAASDSWNNAAIGGNSGESSGQITINGGNIHAEGRNYRRHCGRHK